VLQLKIYSKQYNATVIESFVPMYFWILPHYLGIGILHQIRSDQKLRWFSFRHTSEIITMLYFVINQNNTVIYMDRIAKVGSELIQTSSCQECT
jgi:hypothetical protein